VERAGFVGRARLVDRAGAVVTADELRFRSVTGESVTAGVRMDDSEFSAGEFLMARKVWLDDGDELRQHRVAEGSKRRSGNGPLSSDSGYDRLDNEIMAGRRLWEVAEWGKYPAEVTRMLGDEAVSSDPYALFEHYRGTPLSEVAGQFIDDELDGFLVSLLTGLCWVAAAGIAHRAIGPDTVLWDSAHRSVQITDFSRSTLFGVPRTPVSGSKDWVAREQRYSTCYGRVGPTDDVWAAGRLIFFVSNQGQPLFDRGQLARHGLAESLNPVFGPPEGRPTASDLLVQRGISAPRAPDSGIRLRDGRRHFLEARDRRHPGVPRPPGIDDDITAGGPGGLAGPGTGDLIRPGSSGSGVSPPSDATLATAVPDEMSRDEAAAEQNARRKRIRWGWGQS
jgi:serine/threonine protein kinase